MPSRQPLSIVTVCKNTAETIGRTALSIVTQDFQGFEWVVIDGASTDGTVEVLCQTAAGRVDTLLSEPDTGIYDAMNKGIRHASGEYVLFLNGGDRLHDPSVMRHCITSLGTGDILYGSVSVVDKTGNPVKLYRLEEPVNSRSFFLTHKSVPHPAALIRRALFFQHGFYDTHYRVIADRVFFSRLAKARCSFIPVPIVVADFYLGGVSTNEETTPLVEAELRTWRNQEFPIRHRWNLLRGHVVGARKEMAGLLLRSRAGFYARQIMKRR
jgi:glycosyltransferase involved in cell wall biosynthesis